MSLGNRLYLSSNNFISQMFIFILSLFYCVMLFYAFTKESYLLSFVLIIIYYRITLSFKHKIDYPLKIKINWGVNFLSHFKYLMTFYENFLNSFFCASYMVFVDDSG